MNRVCSGRRSWTRLDGNDGLMTTNFDLEVDLASEGTQRGHTAKEGFVWTWLWRGESPLHYVAEVQAGFSADYDIPEWPH